MSRVKFAVAQQCHPTDPTLFCPVVMGCLQVSQAKFLLPPGRLRLRLMWVPQVRRVFLEPPMDRRGRLDLRDRRRQRVLQVLRAIWDRQEQLECRVIWDLRDRRVILAQRDHRAIWDRRDRRVIWDRQV